MKQFTITFCAIIITLVSFAQGYQPGYIVNNNLDTTQGFISYHSWRINPTEIAFKNQNGSVIEYSATEILSFKVLDKLYEAATVDVESSPDEAEQLTYESQFKIEKKTAFLEAILPGEAGLYSLVSRTGKPNFYIKFSNKFDLLLYKSYLEGEYISTGAYQRSEKITTKNNKFLEQLSIYFKDCASISAKLSGVTYTKKSLSGLFAYYNACSGRQLSVASESGEKIKARWSLIAGYTKTSVKFSSSVTPYLTKADFESSTDFTGGIAVDLIMPHQDNWSIVGELLYASYKVEGVFEDAPSANEFTSVISNFDNHYLKINTLLRFRFPVKNTSIFFNTGMSNGIALKLESSQTEYRRFVNSEQTTELEPYEKKQVHEIGFVIGAGVAYKKFALQGRYNISNGFTVAPQLTSKVSSLKVFLSYQL